MKFLAYCRCVAARVFRRSQIDDDMEEELRSHIQHRADDLECSGLDRAIAERRARIEFGGHVRFKEECREALGGNFLETLMQDARFSLRVLHKSPSFTIVAVVTLAVAIGANAVVFGALNAVILRPLNVPHAESLYGLKPGSDYSMWQSYPDYLDLRDRNRSFDGLAAYNVGEASLDTGNNPSRVWGGEVTANYFDVLRIQPYLGRFFHAADEHGANSAPYIVLSYAYWHTHFQDNRGAVGHTIRLNKHPFTILGVAPPGFHGTLLFFSPSFFVPIVNVEEQIVLEARGTPSLFMTMGHLKAGVTPAQAIADLNSIGSYLKKTYPKVEGKMSFSLARPSLYGDFVGGPARAFLTALMLLAGLILLAACANLGSLFAARAADRTREVALRLALGSSRTRILRTLFTEAVLISLLGGAAGLWGSVELLRTLTAWQPFPQFPINVPVNPDASVYGMAALLSLASGLLFGAVPVRQVWGTDPYQVVKAGHHSVPAGPRGRMGRRITMRDLLLAAQIAICAVLVTSSLVAVRGFVRSVHGNFGFEPRNAMLADTDLNMAGYSGDKAPAMQKRMMEEVKMIPGVTFVGLIDWVPLGGEGWKDSHVFSDTTTDLRPSNAAADATMFKISPEYFRAADTALLTGRDFTWHDDKNAPRVAVINQEFARKLFGSRTKAMGRYYKLPDGTRIQVVGIVEDGHYNSLTESRQPAMFFPILQWPSSATSLVVRYSGQPCTTAAPLRVGSDPQQIASAIRSKLRNLDAGLPALIQTWNEALSLALFPSRVATVSLGLLGMMGAMLSLTGIFGMAAYSVSKRLKELGIRMALGAQRKQVLQAALGRAFQLLAFGSAAGLVLGILASRVLASIVYQATPRDPLVLAGVVLAMALLGLSATWMPAQRALSLDPSILLREE